jgi:cell division septum initiation protein DivIVA
MKTEYTNLMNQLDSLPFNSPEYLAAKQRLEELSFGADLAAEAQGDEESGESETAEPQHFGKKEELEAWSRFAASLPEGCYTKGAMSFLQIEIENALRSDFLPLLSLAEAGAQAQTVRSTATQQAERIVAEANAEAERIVAVAQKEAMAWRERLNRWKYEAMKKIESL